MDGFLLMFGALITVVALPIAAYVSIRNRIGDILTELKRLRLEIALLRAGTETPRQEEVQEGVQAPVQEVVQAPVQEVVQAPVQEVVQPPVQEVVQPPVQEVVQPPVQEVVPPPVQEVVKPPVQEVVQAPVQEVVQPPVQEIPKPEHLQGTAYRAPRTTTKTPKRTASELEALIGGKLLNRIGAIAVLIGTLFFLKYAFENDLINEWGRVLIGFAAGGAMLFLGDRAKKKGLAIFAQGLVGAAIPILYLSIYASYEFYHLVPHIVAFVVMALAGALALAMALRHDSPFIAALGAIGGMLTPAFLSTGDVNTIGLFTFILLLDIGLLAVALQRRRWWFIGVLCTVGTIGWWVAWHDAMSSMLYDQYAHRTLVQWPHTIALIFAYAFAVMWLVYDRFLHASTNVAHNRLDRVLAGTNGFLAIMWTYLALRPALEWQMDLAAAGLAGAYILSALDLRRRNHSPHMVGLRQTHAFFAMVFAAFVLHNDRVLTMLCAGYGLVTLFLLRRETLKLPFFSALIVLILCGFVSFQWIDPYLDYESGIWPVLNDRTGAVMIAAAAFLFSSVISTQRIRALNITAFISILRIAFLLFAVAAIRSDVTDHAAWLSQMQAQYAGFDGVALQAWIGRVIGVMIVAVSGFGMVFIGRWQKDNLLSWAGLSTTAFACGMWLLDVAVEIPDNAYAPLLNLRMASGIILIALWILMFRLHNVDAPFKTGSWMRLSAWALGLMILALASYEAAWPFVILDDENAIQLSLSSVWIVYGIIVMVLGFLRRSRPMRIGSIILLGVSILKVFLFDLRFLEQPYRIVSFIALGVILLLASYLYQRYKHIILEGASSEP